MYMYKYPEIIQKINLEYRSTYLYNKYNSIHIVFNKYSNIYVSTNCLILYICTSALFSAVPPENPLNVSDFLVSLFLSNLVCASSKSERDDKLVALLFSDTERRRIN